MLALTGPRQSGKTTLARAEFPDGAVIDEVQRVPSLLSWLQGVVDERKRMGDFVLTGSAQFDLMAGLTQSLAGCIGRVELLPLSGAELSAAGDGASLLPASLDALLLRGGYPALYDRSLEPADWFGNHVSTYVERDVRQLLSVRNFGKRLVKTPKLYFLDVGLMAWLLGIRDTLTIETHAQRGALFETWVVSELIKQRFNAGRSAELSFWRDSTGPSRARRGRGARVARVRKRDKPEVAGFREHSAAGATVAAQRPGQATLRPPRRSAPAAGR